jgi:hypothetical protein
MVKQKLFRSLVCKCSVSIINVTINDPAKNVQQPKDDVKEVESLNFARLYFLSYKVNQ